MAVTENGEQFSSNNLRRAVGLLSAVIAFVTFSATLTGYIVLKGAFQTWTIGRYFHNRAQIFASLFLVSAVCSFSTLIISIFSSDRVRRVGVVLSLATLAMVMLIFWFER
jgi:hypothetical protein